MHRGLRIPHLRKGDDSPLRIWLLHWIRNACHTQRLPTPRRRRYGHNVTSPTRLRHSTAEWFTRSLRLCSRDAWCVPAISAGICVEICDAVRLRDQPAFFPRRRAGPARERLPERDSREGERASLL